MGLARQSVQRLADVLVDSGMCEYRPNPAHARAKLLSPTNRGRKAIDQIRPGVVAWTDRIAASVGKKALKSTLSTVDTILDALERSEVPAACRRVGRRGKVHG
jgi:DNA-binding MarR family transcriptional regulator